MWPLRPTAIATPGATASSIAVFTTLSSFDTSDVSSPELLRPISGATYFTVWVGAGTSFAVGCGAHPVPAITYKKIKAVKDFIDSTSLSVLGECPKPARGHEPGSRLEDDYG